MFERTVVANEIPENSRQSVHTSAAAQLHAHNMNADVVRTLALGISMAPLWVIFLGFSGFHWPQLYMCLCYR